MNNFLILLVHILIFSVGSFILENVGGVLDIIFSGYFDGVGYGGYAFFLSYLYLVALSFRVNRKVLLILPLLGFLSAFLTRSLNSNCGLFNRTYGLLTLDHLYFYLFGGIVTLIFWKLEKKKASVS